MRSIINKFKKLFHDLTQPLSMEIHELFTKDLSMLVSSIGPLLGLWNIYYTAVEAFREYFKQSRAMFQTQDIIGFDKKRDRLERTIVGRIRSCAAYPKNEAERVAANILLFLINTYKNADRKDYESETAYIHSLGEDFLKPRYAPSVTLLGLDELIAELIAVNLDFENLYLERIHEMETKKVLGNVNRLRKIADDAFQTLCEAISGLMLINTDLDIKAKLEQIIFKINGIIDQYQTINNRRLHHKSPGHNGKDEPDEPGEPTDPQTPDITNPDITNPENPHTPDISNPDIPDFE